jgi:tetratricopeptide (TPR) repeat protein
LIKERAKPDKYSEWIEQADEILDKLLTFYKPEHLMAVLPPKERRYLLDFYVQKEDYWRIYWNKKGARKNLERALGVQQLIGVDEQETRWTRWRLIDALRLLGRDQEASRLAQELLEKDLTIPDRLGITEDYCWMKILAGKPAEAMTWVDRYVEPASKTYNPGLRPLLVERARLSAALSEYERAEADLDRFFREVPLATLAYSDYADACLLRGVLWERRGEPARAIEMWQKGCYHNWPVELQGDPTAASNLDGKPMRDLSRLYYYMVVLGSAAGLVNEQEVSLAFQLQFKVRDATSARAFEAIRAIAPRAEFLKFSSLAKTLTDSCRSTRGKDFLKRLAYHEITFDDYFIEPVMLDVMALIRHTAITAGIPDEVEKIIWIGMRAFSDEVRDDRFDRDHLADILWTYAGSIDSWRGVSSALRGDLVPTMAFVMGHRYLAMNAPERARSFFKIVVDKAPADSPISKLAAKALEEPGPNEKSKKAAAPKRS